MGRLICDSVRRFPFGEGTFDSIGRQGRKGCVEYLLLISCRADLQVNKYTKERRAGQVLASF